MSVRQDKVQVSVVVDGKQGINELGQLEMRAGDLRKSMQGLKRDSAEYAAMSKEYDQVKTRLGSIREELGVTGLTMKQLRAYARELNQEMDNTATKGTARYEELKQKLQQVNGAMNQQKADIKGTQGFWSGLTTEVKQFGMLAVGALGFEFLTTQVSNLIAKGKKLADELSDVGKTTGMTKGEVRELNSELSKMDTRTSTSELRNIATVAGQLGIAKKDVLSFTEATDKLVVSLGDEFQGGAEEVTKSMGGLRNIFSDIKSDKIDQDMLHIGNAINVLASQGAATGPVVADYANRIGGVGITMGLTSGQVLGLSATMQELNISTERGSTAVVTILQKMAAEPAKFAKVAGLGVKEFAHLVNNDLFGAFTKVTEGAGKTGAQATALAGLLKELGVDGAGASEVMAKLGTNTELMQQKVKVAGESLGSTSSIMQEFSTKNDNLAGKLEKLTKAFSGVFTNSAFNSFLEGAVDGLTELFSLTDEADELTKSFNQQQEAVAGLEKNTVPLIDRYEELKGKATRNREEQQELDTIIAQLAATIPTAVTEFDKYGKALDINVQSAREFVAEQKAMMAVMNEEAITANQKKLELYERQVKQLTQSLNLLDDKGRHIAPIAIQDANEEATRRLKPEEIKGMQAELSALQIKIGGVQGVIAKMRGEKTAAELKSDLDARWLAYIGATESGVKAAGVRGIGWLKEIDDKIKQLREQQEAVNRDQGDKAATAKIQAIGAQIKQQEELRAKLLGEYKDKEAAKTEKELKKEHDALLKSFQELQKLAIEEREKLSRQSEDKDQQALNDLDAHYDKLLDRGLEFANSSKLTEAERREALVTVNQLADTRDEARENLKAAQQKRRAAEELKFINDHELAKLNLRILLAKRNQKDNPQEYENALVAKLEKERDIELQNVQLTEDQRRYIIEDSQDKIDAVRDASRDRQTEQEKRALAEIEQYMSQMLNTSLDLFVNSGQKEMAQVNKQKNQRLKALDQQNKAGLISKEKYESEKANIEEQADRRTAKLKEEQFQKQKAANIIQATMDGIMAGMKAWAQLGPFAPTVLPFIAAATLLNIGAILAQPTPAFAEGGFTGENPYFTTQQAMQLPHQNLSQHPGGMLRGGAFLATVNEVGEEYFVPHDLLQQPVVANAVQLIEAVRTGQSGGTQTAGAFAEGGFTGPAPAAPAGPAAGADQQLMQAMYGEMQAMRRAMQEWPRVVRAEVVREEMARSEKLDNTINNDASF